MTKESLIAEVLRASVSVGLLGILYYLWQDYRLDALRHRLFVLRDELFDMGAAGLIPFSHPAYTMLRSLINGYLRFGHRLNLTAACVVSISHRIYPEAKNPPFEPRLNEAAAELDPVVKEKIVGIYGRLQFVIVSYAGKV